MTLDQYIESLIQLRDHYNAGNFIVMGQEISEDVYNGLIQNVYKYPIPMDGDDYHLNLERKQLRIKTKGDGKELNY